MTSIKKSVAHSTGRIAIAGAAAGVALSILNYCLAHRAERNHAPDGDFLLIDGVRLHYSDRGEGTPVVLIHGNIVAGDDWNTSGVAERLLPNHRVIIFDRPGFGHSERPRGVMWTAEQQSELLHKALRQLNVDRPVIVGHSWGTLVALEMAVREPANTAGLVLVSGYYFWTFRLDVPLAAIGALPVLGDLLRYTITPLLGWLKMPLLKRVMFSPSPVPERFQTEFSPAMALRPSQIRASSMDGALMIEGAMALRDQYEKLAMPVTIIAGDNDKVVFKRMSQRLAARIPNSVLQLVPGAGHMVHHLAPQRVADAVESVAVAAVKPVPADPAKALEFAED
jgi:pimeloyl-ACP methyl ester carboxylesterase